MVFKNGVGIFSKGNLFVLMAVSLLLSGCFSNYAKVSSLNFGTPGICADIKEFYVVIKEHDSHAVGKEIVDRLTQKGFVVTSGPTEEISEKIDYIVQYNSTWVWDFITYPHWVELRFVNSVDMVTIAKGTYDAASPGEMGHAYHNVETIVNDVITSMLAECQ